MSRLFLGILSALRNELDMFSNVFPVGHGEGKLENKVFKCVLRVQTSSLLISSNYRAETAQVLLSSSYFSNPSVISLKI